MFDWLLDPYSSGFMVRALGAAVIVGVFAPAVGVWIVLRRLSYLGDAMSHSALGGVGIALLLGLGVTVGALAAGVVVALLIGALSAHPRLREDSVIGVVETALFGIGVLVISRNSSSLGVSLDTFLFGQILTVDETDLVGNLSLMVVGLTALGLLFPDLRAATFDPVHAALVGVRVGPLRVALLMLLAIAIVVSLQTVGLLMSIAMLVTPAAAARLITDRLRTMTLAAVGIGTACAFVGLTASYHLSTPPGATVALAAVAALILTFMVTLPRRTRHRHAAPDPDGGLLGASATA